MVFACHFRPFSPLRSMGCSSFSPESTWRDHHMVKWRSEPGLVHLLHRIYDIIIKIIIIIIITITITIITIIIIVLHPHKCRTHDFPASTEPCTSLTSRSWCAAVPPRGAGDPSWRFSVARMARASARRSGRASARRWKRCLRGAGSKAWSCFRRFMGFWGVWRVCVKLGLMTY